MSGSHIDPFYPDTVELIPEYRLIEPLEDCSGSYKTAVTVTDRN